MLGQFSEFLMSIGQHYPLNDAHISLHTIYCMHPFCVVYLWVYVMTFIILFWLIGSIGGHAGTIFGIFDEHWTALASQWRPYLFTHNLLHASILWGLSMGICDEVHHIILVDCGNSHAGTIFGHLDEHWTALPSQWHPYLFTDTILRASILWGLSTGICDDVHHIILIDCGNRGTCWGNFWIFWWALDSISLSLMSVPLYRHHAACICFVRLIYGYRWRLRLFYSCWLGQ